MKLNLLAAALLCSMPAFAQNYALTFNGTSQYVSIGTPLSGGSSYTKEAWVYTTTNSGARNILSSASSPFWINAGVLNAGQGGSFSLVTDPSSFPLNRWVYVAVTYDAPSSTMKLYRDGALVATATSVTGYTNQNNYIATNDGVGAFFQGNIDEVRIWNTALSLAELKKNMYKGPAANASGLVSYYKFNDGSGTTLTNATGGTNGTLQNTPTWAASPVQYTANALQFDGTDDNVVIPQVISSDFTVEYMMKTTATGSGAGGQWYGGNGIVDAEMPGGTNDFGTALVGTKLGFGIGSSVGAGDITIRSTSDVNTGSWVHVAATWKQSTGQMMLYVNGVQEASATGSTALRNAPTRITLGQMQTAVSFYNGAIDEVRIWNVVRTQSEIQANMAKEIDPSAQTNLVAYYNFNQGSAAGSNAGLTLLSDMKNANNGTMNNFALSSSASNFVGQSGSLVPLRLDWLRFDAQLQQENVLLSWSTANEEKTNAFIVQHSTDGKTWSNIGSKKAAGNSRVQQDYSFVDMAPAQGINYYRILQTDLDGSSSFSTVRAIRTDRSIVSVVSENPVAGNTLKLQLAQQTLLALYNSEGRVLWQQQAEAGSVQLDMSSYAKGIYWLRVNDRTEKILLP